MTQQQLVLGGRGVRPGEAHQLDLVELMDPDQAARLLAVGAGFAPEARAQRDVRQGQLFGRKNVVPMDVGHRHFRRGDQVQAVGGDVHVALEVRELSGPACRIRVHQKRRRHFQVPVFAGVEIEHERGERAGEPRAQAPEQREAGTGDLGAGRQIQNPQRLAQLPVRPRVEVERRRRSP
jgi:hypothetical protein